MRLIKVNGCSDEEAIEKMVGTDERISRYLHGHRVKDCIGYEN